MNAAQNSFVFFNMFDHIKSADCIHVLYCSGIDRASIWIKLCRAVQPRASEGQPFFVKL